MISSQLVSATYQREIGKSRKEIITEANRNSLPVAQSVGIIIIQLHYFHALCHLESRADFQMIF